MKRTAAALLVLLLVPLLAYSLDSVELLTTEYQPFLSASGDAMWCELVDAALSREGIRASWTSHPQEREEAMVAKGENVAFLTGTLVVGPKERPNFIMNDTPLIFASIVAFYPKDKFPNGLGLKGPADLIGKNVGVVRGTGSVAVLEGAGVAIDIADDKDILFKKLVANRNDIAVIADLVGLLSLDQLYPGKAGRFSYEHVYDSPIDLVLSRKHPDSAELKAKYDSGIAKIKADGTFMKILRKYYASGPINRSILPKDMR